MGLGRPVLQAPSNNHNDNLHHHDGDNKHHHDHCATDNYLYVDFYDDQYLDDVDDINDDFAKYIDDGRAADHLVSQMQVA